MSDQDDPIIQIWQRVFPELFQPREAMPALRDRQSRPRRPRRCRVGPGSAVARLALPLPTRLAATGLAQPLNAPRCQAYRQSSTRSC
ncbi:MAG: UPF0182 family protein [Gammaproteobacteria bacterium]|nr:UPF0182 family protein [Gammaproteobacteria bacterium]